VHWLDRDIGRTVDGTDQVQVIVRDGPQAYRDRLASVLPPESLVSAGENNAVNQEPSSIIESS
jgi:hypothetical protein